MHKFHWQLFKAVAYVDVFLPLTRGNCRFLGIYCACNRWLVDGMNSADEITSKAITKELTVKKLTSLVLGAGLLALQGCSSGTPVVEGAGVAQSDVTGSGTLTITSSTNTSYCASVTLTNGLSQATPKWMAIVDLSTSTLSSKDSTVNNSPSTGKVTFTPSGTTSIASGGSFTFKFCANRSGSTIVPTLKGFNFELNVYASCQTNNGNYPTEAALAVAMAMELKRWKPSADLYQSGTNQVSLTSTGLAQCSNGCPNTKALLGQALSSASFTDNVFDPINYGSALWNGLGRDTAHMQNLQLHYPSQLPPDHKLTFIAGPVNLGLGSCGPHYIFQADNLDGSALNSTQAKNMANWLCFYGMNGTDGYGCGGNPSLAFVVTSQGCPIGRTCVAIDPTDGDNSTSSSTSAGSAPSYPMNRVYDPSSSLLGTACITTKGVLTTLQSKCSAYPATCGYDYCM